MSNVNVNIVSNIIDIIISDCNIQSIIFSNNGYKPTTLNKVISCLNISKYKRCGSKNVYCTICCEAVKSNEYVRTLPCQHDYHKRCIDKWLYVSINENEDITCPLCRKKILWY